MQPITRRDAVRTGALALTAALMPKPDMAAASAVMPSVDDLVAHSASLPYAAYLKIDTVRGESQEPAHVDWIDVLSWTWGVEQPGVRMVAGSALTVTPRASFEPLRVFKMVDRCSPVLLRACARAQRFKQAVLHVVHEPEAGGHTVVTEYKLGTVILADARTAVTPVGLGYPALTVDAPPSGRPLEAISLAYARIEMSYWRIGPSGTPDPAVTAGFDLAANKGL